jgi:hypothetical protein
MTCLVGVLILILILTSIDASQIKVLIPTPMEHETDKKPVFIECRNDELFLVPVAELRGLTKEALADGAAQARSEGMNEAEMLQLLKTLEVGTENYRVDLNFALLGQLAISPLEGTKGYVFEDIQKETSAQWYGQVLSNLDKETEMLSFLVRDDSFGVFKRARHLAWQLKVEVAYHLLDVNDLIKFGLGGSVPMAQ